MRKLFVFISMMLAICCNAQNSNNDTNADGKVSIIDVCNTINKAIEKKNTDEVNALLTKLGNTVDETLGIVPRTPVFEDFTDEDGKVYRIGISGAIDLGLSVRWASYNVGAASAAEYGDYFAWGETEPYYKEGNAQVSSCSQWRAGKSGYNWNSYFDSVNGSDTNFKKYAVGKKTELDPEDDVAHVKWHGDWRMPTSNELYELFELDEVFTTYRGIDGYILIGINGNCIFVPAASHRVGADLYMLGQGLHYWSSTLDESYSRLANSMDYGIRLFGADGTRYYGQSVRPVYGKTSHGGNNDGGEEAN